MNKNIATAALFSSAVLSSSVLSLPAFGVEEIETITVNAAQTQRQVSDIAGTIHIIDHQTIQASGAVNLTDLLRLIPSVNISQSGPFGALTEIRFRGSESNHVLVTINGIEVNDNAQGGLVDLAHLNFNNIERIEVLSGPQSAQWGSAAVAGVINIVTTQEDERSITGNAEARFDNKNTQYYGINAGQLVDDLSWNISVNRIETDGENISLVGDEKDGYTNNSFSTKVVYTPSSEHLLSLFYRYSDYKTDFDAIDFSTGLPADANNVTDGKQSQLGLTWHFSPTDNLWSQQLSLHNTQHDNQNTESGLPAIGTNGDKTRVYWNNQFVFNNDVTVNLAYEHVNEEFEQTGPISFGDPNQTQDISANSLIGEGTYQFNTSLAFSAQYRTDHNSDFDDQDSFRIGANFQVNNHMSIFISRSKAIKNPTFTERFGFFPGTFVGNNAILPEASYSNEIGLVTQVNGVNLHAAIFDTTLIDEIDGFVFVPATGQFTAGNSELISKRSGLEISADGELKDIAWTLTYAYLDASENNAAELRRSRHSASGSIQYRFSSQHNIFVHARYTGSREDRFFPPFPQPAQIVGLEPYWLVNSNYQYKVNDTITANVSVSNALDATYENVVGYSGQSRHVHVGIRANW